MSDLLNSNLVPHNNLRPLRHDTDWDQTLLNSCEDPHRLSAPRHFAAFAVPGALSDHYRRIRQFGADPLMYYLYGEP
jgi:hypothetical protein